MYAKIFGPVLKTEPASACGIYKFSNAYITRVTDNPQCGENHMMLFLELQNGHTLRTKNPMPMDLALDYLDQCVVMGYCLFTEDIEFEVLS